MNSNEQLLIKFLSTMTGEDFASVKKSLKDVTAEEEHENGIQTYNYVDGCYIVVSEHYDFAVIYNFKIKDDYNYNYLIQLSEYATFYSDGKGAHQTKFYNYGDDFENAHELAESVEKLVNCGLFQGMDPWDSYKTLSALFNECSLDYCAENCDNFYIEDTETLFNELYCVPDNISSYIDYERFENDLTFDNYISLGGRVLYYGC